MTSALTVPYLNNNNNYLIDLLCNSGKDFKEEIFSCAKDNQRNFDRLEEQLNQPVEIIPFIGAGLSVQYGYPTWSKFLLDVAEQIGCKKEIEEYLSKWEYEKAGEVILKARGIGAFEDDLEEAYKDRSPTSYQLKGPTAFIPILARGPVITTNYDPVLENMYTIFGRNFEKVVGAQASMAMKAMSENRRFLLKIHGDVLDRHSRILSKNEYDKYYGEIEDPSTFSKDLPKLLRTIFKTRCVLFLGCSLASDRIMNILQDIATEEDAISHYAIVPMPSEESFLERSRFLADRRIRPIWYPHDQHQMIGSILAYIAQTYRQNDPLVLLSSALNSRDGDQIIAQGLQILDRAPYFDEVKRATALGYTCRVEEKAKMGDIPGSLLSINNAIQLQPDEPAFRMVRAVIYCIKGDFSLSNIDLDTCERSGFPMDLIKVIRIYNFTFAGQSGKALKLLNELGTPDSEYSKSLRLIRGIVYLEQEEIDKGVLDLEYAAEMDANYKFLLEDILSWIKKRSWWKDMLVSFGAGSLISLYSASLNQGVAEDLLKYFFSND